MSATTVYQYFAASGALIYVGITDRGVRRLHEHADSKPWWEIATGCTLEHFETREQALAREEQLIRRYCPPYNYQHNPERALPLKERVARRLPNVRIPNACQDCFERPPLSRKRRCLVCQQQWEAGKEARIAEAKAAAERKQQEAAVADRARIAAAEAGARDDEVSVRRQRSPRLCRALSNPEARALHGRMSRMESLDELNLNGITLDMDDRVRDVMAELLAQARADGLSMREFRRLVNTAVDEPITIPISA